MQNGLIILDRDGILNKLLVREDGSLDSPMTIDEIEIFPWVPEQINIITKHLKYDTAIATNQPAFAKGKISKGKLLDINDTIIDKSFYPIYVFQPLEIMICLHRAEDNCCCRKPKPGMLNQLFDLYDYFEKQNSWMVGDRATDIIAGHNAGVNTAFLDSSVENDLDILKEMEIIPTYHGKDLRDFVLHLKKLNI